MKRPANGNKTKTALAITIIALIFSLGAAAQPVVGSYYAADGNPDAVSKLPAEKLTHILYAFLALCGDNEGAGEATLAAIEEACKGKQPYEAIVMNERESMTEFAAFEALKARHPHLVVLPSFGGWTLSKPFHGMARTEAGRQRFVRTAVALIERHGVFDGIDIDWEYPGGGGNSQATLTGQDAEREKSAFQKMMQELREGLNALTKKTGRRYQLTAAVSGSDAKTDAIDWRNTAPHMDYVFTMTYDFAVGDGQAAHHANLFPADESRDSSAKGMIDNLMQAGVPAGKLVAGVAFYGRGWKGSDWDKNKFQNKGGATSTGSYIYKDLAAAPPKGYQYGYDSKAEAAYFFNPDNGGFISYDDPRSVSAKARWAKRKGLAGLFSWQIRQDNGELLDAMYQGMTGSTLQK